MYDTPVYQLAAQEFYPLQNANLALLTPAVIRAAIQTAIAAAALVGGTVYYPSGRILLDQPLVPASGVRHKGVPPQLVYNTIPDSGLTALVGSQGGTVIVPNGAFAGFTWNTTALGAPASQTAFSKTGLSAVSFEDLGFSGDLGGTWAIQAGATNNASAWYSQFKNIYATGFTVSGGFSFTNYQHCEFIGNYTFGCAWGQQHNIDVASASLAPGNSTYYDLYTCNPTGSGAASLLSRNITFLTTATTGGAANNNEFKFDRIQSNRFGGTTITQAATMVNTQANITITDGTKFAVGLPVTVSATQNGFTVGTIYFVISVVANVIQLSLTYGGAAITATAANAVNIVHTGFPCFEMIALAGSAMTNAVIDNLDMEGFATAAAVFQNCNGFDVTLSQTPGTGASTVSVCGRTFVNSTLKSSQACNTDMDGSGPARAYWFYGTRNTNAGIGNPGAGIWYDTASSKAVLSLGGAFNSVSAGDLTFDSATSNGLLGPKAYGIGQLNKQVSGAAYTVANLNLIFNNTTASGVTITLPTVTAAMQGSWLEFTNGTASAQTISTDGTQVFNGVAGRTTLTLNPNASVRLTMNLLTYWIAGASSTIVSGVISAPT